MYTELANKISDLRPLHTHTHFTPTSHPRSHIADACIFPKTEYGLRNIEFEPILLAHSR